MGVEVGWGWGGDGVGGEGGGGAGITVSLTPLQERCQGTESTISSSEYCGNPNRQNQYP